MGNCLTSNKVAAQSEKLHEEEDMIIKQATEVTPTPKLEASKRVGCDEKKKKTKMVRYKLDKEGHVDRKREGDSVVRVRVVMTKEELKQILGHEKDFKSSYSSVEQLVSALKLRGRLISEVKTGDNRAWRPALESIPEDH